MGALDLPEAFRDQTPVRQHSGTIFTFISHRWISASLSTSLHANHLRAGNVGQMTDPLGWNFHRHLIDVFGGVAKYHGLFGVCSAGIKVYARIDFITIAQATLCLRSQGHTSHTRKKPAHLRTIKLDHSVSFCVY
jgi:hypothetical protein